MMDDKKMDISDKRENESSHALNDALVKMSTSPLQAS
jgi:hypothetical protein